MSHTDKISEQNGGGMYSIENAHNLNIINRLKSAPSIILDLENRVYMAGDCGSCPSCACIEADFQVLAVIEAPATVPLMVGVGAIRFAS